MIGIGVQLGGPEQKGGRMERVLSTAMQTAAKYRDPYFDQTDDGWVNPIFIVPGSLVKPGFDGYKLGYFSKKKRGIVIQISVPQSVVDGQGIEAFIVRALREAVRMAASRFSSEGMSFSTLKAEKVILAIERSLG